MVVYNQNAPTACCSILFKHTFYEIYKQEALYRKQSTWGRLKNNSKTTAVHDLVADLSESSFVSASIEVAAMKRDTCLKQPRRD